MMTAAARRALAKLPPSYRRALLDRGVAELVERIRGAGVPPAEIGEALLAAGVDLLREARPTEVVLDILGDLAVSIDDRHRGDDPLDRGELLGVEDPE